MQQAPQLPPALAVHHVVQVAGHIWEGEGRVSIDGDFGRAPLLTHADDASIIDRIATDVDRAAARVYQANVILTLRLMQCDVLPNEHADADA